MARAVGQAAAAGTPKYQTLNPQAIGQAAAAGTGRAAAEGNEKVKKRMVMSHFTEVYFTCVAKNLDDCDKVDFVPGARRVLHALK